MSVALTKAERERRRIVRARRRIVQADARLARSPVRDLLAEEHRNGLVAKEHLCDSLFQRMQTTWPMRWSWQPVGIGWQVLEYACRYPALLAEEVGA